MKSKGLLGLIGMFTAFWVSAAVFAWAGPDDGGWKKVKEDEGIQVYTRSLKGTSRDEFMGVGQVNAPIEVVKEVWLDFPSYPQWFGFCKEFRRIRTLSPTQHHYLVYYVSASPSWAVGVQDRDAVVEVRAEVLSGREDQVIIHLKALKEPLVPVKPDHIRITDMTGHILLTKITDKTTHVVFSLRYDPGGRLPPRVVQQVSVNRPWDTIKGLREMVKKDVYVQRGGIHR